MKTRLRLTRPARKKNIIQLIDKLPKSKIDVTQDLKQAYYEAKKVSTASDKKLKKSSLPQLLVYTAKEMLNEIECRQ